MLQITIVNVDGSFGVANYDWVARINDEVIDAGSVYNFSRSRGWKELVGEVIKSSEKNKKENE